MKNQSSLLKLSASIITLTFLSLLILLGFNSCKNLEVPVIPPTDLNYSVDSAVVSFGTSGNSVTPSINNGGGEITFTLKFMPNGVSIEPNTGIIHWDTTVVANRYEMKVTAYNSQGYISTNYVLVVNGNSGGGSGASVVAPTNYNYSPAQSTANAGVAGNSAAPAINNGGGTIVYGLFGAPNGISVNPATGVISWASTVAAGTYSLILNATNSVGQASTTYTLVLNTSGGGGSSLSNLSYTPSTINVYHGVVGNSATPTITGSGVITYSLSNPPAGVTINPSSGVISWSNAVDYGTYNLMINASNGTFSTTASYTLNINLNPDDYLTPHYTNVNVSTVYYTTPNNNYHNVDVYTPVGDPHTKRPAFMFLHGGGFQSSGTKTESYVVTFCTYMAQCGYVAFAPNYNEGSGHTLPQNAKAVIDANLCLDWIRNNGATYNFDPKYLFIGGGSAGGHLVCNLSFYDGSTNYSSNGVTGVNLTNVIAFADCWGSSPSADRLYSYSSLNSHSLPVFIVHGTSDQTVPVSESVTLNNYLTSAHSIVDFWQIAGETHGCPNHRAAISDTMSHFFNRVWKQTR